MYLSTVDDYVETTGDMAFLKEHWSGIRAAWRYGLSLVDSRTGLASVPAGTVGGNEQLLLHDDPHLSAEWIKAAGAFSRMSRMRDDAELAREGEQAAERARRSVTNNYWDESQGLWFGGHTISGKPVTDVNQDAVPILLEADWAQGKIDRALDRLASPEFQTDWGMRGMSVTNPGYEPNAYASGAVWGFFSTSAATIFWNEHRPFTAWNDWHGLVPWTLLDSPGHFHEVLAGDLFHPELESVPEQMFSSAGFLNAAVHGLLGLQVHGAGRTVLFAPHLPGNWDHVDIKGVRVGASRLDLHMTENEYAITLQVYNPGAPVNIEFDPQLPLGARLQSADIDDAPVKAAVTQSTQDQHARLVVHARTGVTRTTLHYADGVRIVPVEATPRTGDTSVNLKLVSADLSGGELRLKAYAADADHAGIDLMTPMKIVSADGADVSQIAKGQYRLTLHVPQQARADDSVYAPVEVRAKLESEPGIESDLAISVGP